MSDLDREPRGRLRTLSKESAERAARHLVMAGRLLDSDPELAYEHAQAAVRSAGRVDVVREAAGLTAYRTGRYAEALRELRTVRRLNGSSEHLPIMADCERGLGRPDRALALGASPEAEALTGLVRVELAIVVSGSRVDLGQYDAALAVLDAVQGRIATEISDREDAQEVAERLVRARASALEAAGRLPEAEAVLASAGLSEWSAEADDDVVVYDLTEEFTAPGSVDPEGSADIEGAADSAREADLQAGTSADAETPADAEASAEDTPADAPSVTTPDDSEVVG